VIDRDTLGPMADLRVEKGKLTRERLIQAGRALFGARGYEDTPVSAILLEAGVTRGSLYHHFETKEALFEAVLDRVVAEIADTAAEAARAAPDPVASLRAGFAAWLRMALDPAVQRIALVDAPAVVGWTRWRDIDERHILGGLRANLRRIAKQGRLPPGDVDLFTHMLLAAVNEAALLIARAPDPKAALATGQQAVDALLDRLISDAPGPPT
jgi:AcrR family transcriptional regulator